MPSGESLYNVRIPGVVHLQAAERELQYVRVPLKGITYCGFGAEV